MSGPASTSAGRDRRTGFRVGVPEETWGLKGDGKRSQRFAYMPSVQLYDNLIELAPDFSLRPALAVAWRLLPDGCTWRFKLRRDVLFHDGTPFTADDVVWSWGVRQINGGTLSTIAAYLQPGSVSKVDDYTVDFKSTRRNLRLPEQMVHPEGAILKRGYHNDSTPAVGTGPFRLVRYQPKVSTVVERYDSYWGDKPTFQRLDIHFIGDASERLRALEEGSVDVFVDVPPTLVKLLDHDDRFRIVRTAPARSHVLYINRLPGRPTEDRRVREAIANAIDREHYVDEVLGGNGLPGRWMLPSELIGEHSQEEPIHRFDPALARSMLGSLGWTAEGGSIRMRQGLPLRLVLIAQRGVPQSGPLAIQSYLRDVGIDVRIIQAQNAFEARTLYEGGAFDLDLELPNQNDANPAFLPLLRMYGADEFTAPFSPGREFDEYGDRVFVAESVAEVRESTLAMLNIASTAEFVALPIAATGWVHATRSDTLLAAPHPSLANQKWSSLQYHEV